MAYYKIKEIYVLTDFAAKLTQHVFGMNDAKFTVAELYGFARSNSQKFVINGVNAVSTSDQKHGVEGELYEIASVIYLYVWKRRWESGKIMSVGMEKMRQEREAKGLFKGTVHYLREVFTNFKDTIIHNITLMLLPDKKDIIGFGVTILFLFSLKKISI